MKGKVFVFGDNVDTDVIAPGGYLHLGMDQLLVHTMEALDPEFHKTVRHGDIIVAGENFGSGSSREQAPMVLREAGISLIAAKSFARIFFRNSFNVGLPLALIPDISAIGNGHAVEHSLENGYILDIVSGKKVVIEVPKGPLLDILNSGGMINFVRQELEKIRGKSGSG